MFTTQRTSVLKKKGLIANGQFQNMHLAVYPFQVEFLQTVDHQTVFYFQKNYQVIGELNKILPPCDKTTKYQLKSVDNIIHFRLFSQENVVYKWSIYRRFENGEEEFADCGTINLKEIVTNYVIPMNSQARSLQSMLNLSFNSKELRLKFPKIGMILNFVLFVSDDPKNIREEVERKYIPVQQQRFQLKLPTQVLLKAESNENENKQPNKKIINNIEQQSSVKRDELGDSNQLSGSIPMLKNQSKDQRKDNNIAQPLDLDDLILTDPGTAQKKEENTGTDDQFKQIQKQIEQRKQQIDNKIAEQHLLKQADALNEEDKQGILKLQSDQGRVNQDPIDTKLQEMEVIQQERRSMSRQTINGTIAPRFRSGEQSSQKIDGSMDRSGKLSLPNKTQTPEMQKSHMTSSMQSQSSINFKKVMLVFIVAIILFIVAATLSRNFNKKRIKLSKIK